MNRNEDCRSPPPFNRAGTGGSLPDNFSFASPGGATTLGGSSQLTSDTNGTNVSGLSTGGQRAYEARRNAPRVYLLSQADLYLAETAQVGSIKDLFDLAKTNAMVLYPLVGTKPTHVGAKKAFLQEILDKMSLGTPKAMNEVAFKLQELDQGLVDVQDIAYNVGSEATKKIAEHQPNLNVANAFLYENHDSSFNAAETFVLLVHYVRNGFSGDDFDERFLGDRDMMEWIALKVTPRIASLADLCDKLKVTEDTIKTFPQKLARAILQGFHYGKLFEHPDYQQHLNDSKNRQVIAPNYPTDKIPTSKDLSIRQMHAALFLCFGFTPSYGPGYSLFEAKVGADNDGWVRDPKLVGLDAIGKVCKTEYKKLVTDLEETIDDWFDTTLAQKVQDQLHEEVPKHFGAINQVDKALQHECCAVRDKKIKEIRDALVAAAHDPALINSLLAAHNKKEHSSDKVTPASPDVSL